MVALCIVVVLVSLEAGFRYWHNVKFARPYHVSIKFPWKDSHVVTHPYLSFAYKKNGTINKNQKLPYPIHTNKYCSFYNPLSLNNIGHFGKDIELEKKENVLRVFCLGASTTANNISDGEKDYSYPDLLQQYLEEKFNDQEVEVEVVNCGIGGWASPDILINFVLNLVKYKPDYIILYHGYNDLGAFLTKDFQPDYQHFRRNLGEIIHKIKFAYFFPKVKFWHSYEFVKDKIFGTGNVRNDVLHLIKKKPIDFTLPYRNLKIENDIIKNILIIAKYYNIKCVLSSFAFYDYEKTWQSHKLKKGVEEQNILRKKLAEEFKCAYINQDSLIPKREKYFVDSVHFTPAGMNLLANNFSEVIKFQRKHA